MTVAEAVVRQVSYERFGIVSGHRVYNWITLQPSSSSLTNRHFPFGFRLEPIQARNVSYSNNLRLPHVDSSSYSCLRPRFQGSYTWNMLL